MIENLKAIRKARGMTQAELAEATHIHRITITKYELGLVSPTLKNAMRIAEALGVKVEDLSKKAG